MRRGFHVVVPVLVGGLIYCAFRSPDHLLFQWADTLALSPFIDWLRSATSAIRPDNEWVLYSLPDGLWLYAFAFAMTSTWHERGVESRAWRLLPLALALGSEAAQGVGVLQGTFDPADVATYLAAHAMAVILHSTASAVEEPA